MLAKAFRGALVPQDPTDEPASVLLDRLRAGREKELTRKTSKKISPTGSVPRNRRASKQRQTA
jgi:type I restriction enzyme S subunit